MSGKEPAIYTRQKGKFYYVVFTANGNKLIAKSSNFNVAKESSPAPDVTPAQNLQLTDGENAGDMDLEFDKVTGAKGYVYQVTTDPLTAASVWTSTTGTARKTTFKSLTIGVRHHSRIIAIGKNGQGVYSQVVSRIVQ